MAVETQSNRVQTEAAQGYGSQESDLDLTAHLALVVGCDRTQTSVVLKQYATYPFRLSRRLNLDPSNSQRVYLYVMSSSPGLLAGDDLRVHIRLKPNAQLYLTDQAATKVHRMPNLQTSASLTTDITLDAGSTLEYVPEPLILFSEAALHQTTQITLHPEGRLFFSDLVLPGRLARQECYQFRLYANRLQVRSPAGELLLQDAACLQGEANPFRASRLVAPYPAIANAIVCAPDLDLPALMAWLDTFSDGAKAEAAAAFQAGYSPLPHGNGLVLRAMAANVWPLKAYLHHALAGMRQITGQAPLPTIPK